MSSIFKEIHYNIGDKTSRLYFRGSWQVSETQHSFFYDYLIENFAQKQIWILYYYFPTQTDFYMKKVLDSTTLSN